MITSRETIARYIEKQFTNAYDCKLNKGQQHHYGKQELRELMDFIFEGPPRLPEEEIKGVKYAPRVAK